MKNALKKTFSRYFNFCLNFLSIQTFVHQKDKVNFKIYNVTIWEINNCNTHITQYLKTQRQPDNNEILPVTVFLKNHTQNVVEKLFLNPYLLITGLKFQFAFVVRHVESYRNILKISCIPLTFTSYKAFQKTERGLGLVFLPFSA